MMRIEDRMRQIFRRAAQRRRNDIARAVSQRLDPLGSALADRGSKYPSDRLDVCNRRGLVERDTYESVADVAEVEASLLRR